MADQVRSDQDILDSLRITSDGRVNSQRIRDLYVTLAARGPEPAAAGADALKVARVAADGVTIEYVPLPADVLPPITPEDEGKFVAVVDGVFALVDIGDVTPSAPGMDFTDGLNSQFIVLLI